MIIKEKVYFAAGGGRIKVGTTIREVSDRITAINAHLAEPLEIIGVIAGGLPMERAVQTYLNQWHLRGEWFRDCDDVRVILGRLVKGGPDAIGYDGPMFSNERPCPIPKTEIERPRDPRMFGRMAALVWGDSAVAELCALAGVDAQRAGRWIEGSERPPRLVRIAFGYVVTEYGVNERVASFLDSGEDGPATFREAV